MSDTSRAKEYLKSHKKVDQILYHKVHNFGKKPTVIWVSDVLTDFASEETKWKDRLINNIISNSPENQKKLIREIQQQNEIIEHTKLLVKNGHFFTSAIEAENPWTGLAFDDWKTKWDELLNQNE